MITIFVISALGFVCFDIMFMQYSPDTTLYETHSTQLSYFAAAVSMGVICIISSFNIHILLGWLSMVGIGANFILMLTSK